MSSTSTTTPMAKYYLVTAVIVILCSAGAFVAGVKVNGLRWSGLAGMPGESRPQMAQVGNRLGGQNPRGAGNNLGSQVSGRMPTMGTILSIDGSSMTLQMPDGSSKIIMLSESTQVHKTSDATQDELEVGINVRVMGAEGDAGTITAQEVQIVSTSENLETTP